ncbi:hypothetical protein P3T37_004083 [Kitasatospora sp. MAA4]|uniref:DUF5324 family protein n=1 Tax=Kitasatospora sp. MAA4 TaxID=3035093 RepID=UPI002475124B|nr:DUF5324 family protein [Kitasatospora sp. MAA4]MDH6134679.1 hypothetical protein [Kitasatospora sp. MAA4]
MTRLDTARENAGKTLDTLAPYAAGAKDTAAHYADEARQRLGPALDALGPRIEAATGQARAGSLQAAQTARVGYVKHVAPRVEHAFAALPPKAQENTLRAVHRAQEAALAAKHSADRAGAHARTTTLPRIGSALDDARAVTVPLVQEAQQRGSAALTALHGNVSAEEINKLAARNAKKAHRSGLATGLAIAGTVAVGSGVLVWQWWRKQSEPEWLIEPPAVQGPPNTVHPASSGMGASATGAGTPGTAPLNGSAPDAPDPGRDTADRPHTAGTPDDHPKPHDPRKPH